MLSIAQLTFKDQRYDTRKGVVNLFIINNHVKKLEPSPAKDQAWKPMGQTSLRRPKTKHLTT